MSGPDDLELRRQDDGGETATPEVELERAREPGLEDLPAPDAASVPARAERFPFVLAAAAAAVVTLAALVAYLLLRPARAPQVAASSAPPARAAAAPTPSATPAAGATPEAALALPALGDSDGVVREWAARLSADPRFADWLAASDLVRRLAAIVINVAGGEDPRPHAAHLAPRERFQVTRRGGRLVVDPAAYARYDALVDTFASLDAAGSARALRLLSPLIAAAWRELGQPEGGFDDTLAAATAALLAVPVIEGDLPVRPMARPVLLYAYEDARLERLSPAQKQLLRMGPRNVRRVQDKLRELAAALGPSPGAAP